MKSFLLYISFYISLATVEVILLLSICTLFGLVHVESYSVEDVVRTQYALKQFAIIALAIYILNLGLCFSNLLFRDDSTKSE